MVGSLGRRATVICQYPRQLPAAGTNPIERSSNLRASAIFDPAVARAIMCSVSGAGWWLCGTPDIGPERGKKQLLYGKVDSVTRSPTAAIGVLWI